MSARQWFDAFGDTILLGVLVGLGAAAIVVVLGGWWTR